MATPEVNVGLQYRDTIDTVSKYGQALGRDVETEWQKTHAVDRTVPRSVQASASFVPEIAEGGRPAIDWGTEAMGDGK